MNDDLSQTIIDFSKKLSQKKMVLSLIYDHAGLNSYELEKLCIGLGFQGDTGARRCRELRAEGEIISKEIEGRLYFYPNKT